MPRSGSPAPELSLADYYFRGTARGRLLREASSANIFIFTAAIHSSEIIVAVTVAVVVVVVVVSCSSSRESKKIAIYLYCAVHAVRTYFL